MLRIGSIVLGVDDVLRATTFWGAAIGYVPLRPPSDDTWIILVPADGIGSQLALAKSEAPAQARPRIHLDLYAIDQKAEIKRLLELGAREVEWDSYPPDADFVVLEDPDGNRFCVIEQEESWLGFKM